MAPCLSFPLVGNPSERYIKETKQSEERFRTSRNDKQVFAPFVVKISTKSLKSPFLNSTYTEISKSLSPESLWVVYVSQIKEKGFFK